jgi:ppGpp synthetase/RelA/SpoT-type nucleotidyltranferase
METDWTSSDPEAPLPDEGDFSDPRHPGQLILSQEVFVSDSDVVSEGVEKFMSNLYGTDRYADHNDRILTYHARYAAKEDAGEEEHAAIEIDRMAIALHDFVEHTILNPEKTATKLGLEPEQAAEIKSSALARFNEMLDEVGDQDGLIKAYLFAIDASKWESAARVWRHGATTRINEMIADGRMSEYSGVIVNAAINKTKLLGSADKEELARVLKMKDHCLIDLKLGAISQGTLNHNIQGLFLKALETLDIIEHPPKGNPASTYRDCTEAINFFVPALATLGYKDLAMDLRGAALKWLFDDPHGDAKRQNTVSERHFNDIRNTVTDLHDQEFGGIEADVASRVKTEGSLREKLASADYEGLHLVPDGIGFAFVVPDEMAGEEMMQFARSYMDRLTAGPRKIISKHPNEAELAFEEKDKASGYKAIHMTFYYYPDDGSNDEVPFEIQVLTASQNTMKLYGRSSDLFYKAGTSYTPPDQQHLDRLAKRAQAEREMAPGSTVQSIAEGVALSPEIPSVFNKLFRAIDTAKGERILVPIELEGVARAISDILSSPAGEAAEDLIVLPASKVTENQFKEALNMFDRELASDKNILNALALIKNSKYANSKRVDGKTTTLEGHLLPTALSALMLAIQSGKIWDSDNVGPQEYMSNIVTITILHDYIEAALEDDENAANIPETRQKMLFEIKRMFGTPIMEGVDAMTLPMEIEDQYTRRDQYRQNIQANGYAKLIKPADRWHNHVTDLIKLAAGQAPAGSTLYQKIMGYFAKTDHHQSADFTSEELSDVYTRVHDVIWQLAKHYGYEQGEHQPPAGR